jgi:hypothetical protein
MNCAETSGDDVAKINEQIDALALWVLRFPHAAQHKNEAV